MRHPHKNKKAKQVRGQRKRRGYIRYCSPENREKRKEEFNIWLKQFVKDDKKD